MTPQAGVEPPSGQKGEGTLSSPFDAGNAPENTTDPQYGVEPPSGQQGEGSLNSPFDAGNAAENPSTTSSKLTDNLLESPSTSHQGSGLPLSPPNSAQAEKIIQSKETDEALQKSPSPPKSGAKSTGLAADGGNFDAASPGAGKEAGRLRSLDREVSPGTRADGSHATTSGDRGESYEPSKLNKLKGKFKIGGGR